MKIVFFANTDWYLYNFRLGLAKFLRESGYEVVLISPPGPYGERLQQEGFRWIELVMDRRSMDPRRELGVLRQISAIYAAEKPDIVHHFTIKCVVYGSLVAWRRGIHNCVNAVAGLGYVYTSKDLRARLLRPMVQQLMKFVGRGKHSRLILQNHDDYSAFGRAKMPMPENLRLIRGSGVDTALYQPRPREAPRPVTRILLAARLLWDKGIGEYVEAARMLRDEKIPVEFLLAGVPDWGNPTAVPLPQIEAWQTEGLITYLGHVSEMPQLLETVDIAVLPSYREGAPRSLTEAAAAGLPIITSDVPGCREVVEDRVNGLLIPVRQVAPLVKAIRYLHERPDERARMGKAGRKKVLQEFDQRIVFEKTLGVYRELLAHSPVVQQHRVLQA